LNTTINNVLENNGKPSDNELMARIKGLNWLFLLTVVIPTFLSVIYFGLIASDVYISESRFVVRSPERQTASPFGSLLKGSGFSSSQDDAYTVQDYILSRDALKSLNDKLNIDSAFASKDVDIFSRFAGLDLWENSFEALHEYYQEKVEIELDSMSSIATLTVRSFTAEDSFRINEHLIKISEALINQLNETAREDMVRFATDEVLTAETKAKAAALKLSAYRNLKGVIDPERQTALELEQIVKMQDELITYQTQLSQLQAFAKSNPQIPSLQLRIKNLIQKIKTEIAQVAGNEHSLANKAAQYQRLALERNFSDKQLASAFISLEQARNEAQRKQLYLEIIVQPSNPDKAMEPRRIRGILSTFLLGLISWGVLTMLLAGVREHQD